MAPFNTSMRGPKRKIGGGSWLRGLLSHFLVGVVAFHLGLVVGGGGKDSMGAGIDASTSSSGRKLFKETLDDLFTGSVTVPREDFIREYDIGVPWDEPIKGASDVMILYSSESSLPAGHSDQGGGVGSVSYSSAKDATANCHIMKVILTEPKQENVCFVVVAQWESFHVHHFMRLKPEDDKSDRPVFDTKYPLRYVSRRHELMKKKGIVKIPQLPESYQTRRYWTMLIEYLQKLETTTKRLKPIAAQVAGEGNTVIVMVCNFGQSELLFNFVCSARARGLDLSKILLFATDTDISDLAKALGIAVFDVDDAFGEMPTVAAKNYGDRAFQGMMMSKLYSVHLINALGYDLLFQDVDVVWKRDPLEYFHSPESGNFDFYFQDDGAHSNRYTPYSPNSGFYYVRQTERTKYFFEVFIRMGELIVASGSHQSVLNGLLTEHASSTGLRVKVFQRDSTLGQAFPGGFHYHKRKNFMKEVISGRRSPYIFHMSWTTNKENKQRYFQQLGDWYVNEDCVSKPLGDIVIRKKKDLSGQCCSAEPIVVCHYRDKPSKIPCKDFPSIDHNAPSFW